MKVLVTGASGFVGREILRRLRQEGHRVRILARHPQSERVRAAAAICGAEIQPGDVLKPASLVVACDGVEAVIHLVGIISEVAPQTFENVHTRGTENIVHAARVSGIERYVHMSALGTRPNSLARYHQSKWAAEEIVRSSGLEWTIFRPSIIYGPGDGFVSLFAKIIRRSPIVPILGGGRTRFQPVPVVSVAAAFVGALTEPLASGEIFDLCGPQTFTLDGMVDEILGAMRKKRLKLHVPMAIARAQAECLEFLFASVLGKPPLLNRDQLLMLKEDSVGNPETANQLFGLTLGGFRKGIEVYLSPWPKG